VCFLFLISSTFHHLSYDNTFHVNKEMDYFDTDYMIKEEMAVYKQGMKDCVSILKAPRVL